MSEVRYLAPNEVPQVDSRQLEVLCLDLGPMGAEDVVCRATEDLGLRLFEVQELALQGAREDLHKGLRGLAAVAKQIGLTGLATVARDVMTCIETGDAIAEAATLARLGRIGERSLSELWAMQDLSL